MNAKKGKKPQGKKPKEPDVKALDARVREEALRLAEGDASRIEVVSETEAIVRG